MTYNPNMFDDQYIGCSDKLEKYVMPQVLHKEKANMHFKEAWVNATEHWEEIKDGLTLPEGFEDEYGIALLTFTNGFPKGNPIHQQLNGNLTIAGASRRDYMEKFHFKALHFYLTRALQTLKPNCDVTYTTYRGSPHSYHVPPVFRFGRFTSSSLNLTSAQEFGTESLFQITTCFGARIGDLSFFPGEEEVLIPPTEKFQYVRNEHPVYILNSTGKMCSYFNCAYLEAEKQKDPICRSDTTQSMEETQDGKEPFMMSALELEERLSALEEHISRNHLYWKRLLSDLQTTLHHLSEKENATFEALGSQIREFSNLAFTLLDTVKAVQENEGKMLKTVVFHQSVFKTLKEELTEQKATIQGLIFWMVTFGVTGASILIHKYWTRRP